ncbi:uncharacterized protein LOC133662547 isoform X3 [Entelurus aequoreus]|uniref:uncharacterized protein LOC133662547 isoform X3 n=1 Tax=Entelurus aequoreus TaxID=161455 RepID=UPI002B1D62BB|nr:uncharacterized protein LOC133662547 isoform X3 [Entelurus aequoreus]
MKHSGLEARHMKHSGLEARHMKHSGLEARHKDKRPLPTTPIKKAAQAVDAEPLPPPGEPLPPPGEPLPPPDSCRYCTLHCSGYMHS